MFHEYNIITGDLEDSHRVNITTITISCGFSHEVISSRSIGLTPPLLVSSANTIKTKSVCISDLHFHCLECTMGKANVTINVWLKDRS